MQHYWLSSRARATCSGGCDSTRDALALAISRRHPPGFIEPACRHSAARCRVGRRRRHIGVPVRRDCATVSPSQSPQLPVMQDFDSYVVCLIVSGDPEPFAHFLAEGDAAGYARKRINTRGIEHFYIRRHDHGNARGLRRGYARRGGIGRDCRGRTNAGSNRRGPQAGVGTGATGGDRRDPQVPGTLMITPRPRWRCLA
jgi:hypothetical protein